MKKIVVFAPKIFIGGGLFQLYEIINDLKKKKYDLSLYLDSRISTFEKTNLKLEFEKIKFINKNFFIIFYYDFIINIFIKYDILISISNFPSVFCFKNKNILFIQNRYYLEKNLNYLKINIIKKIKILFIRYLIRSKVKYYKKIIVQTNTTKKMLVNNLNIPENLVDRYFSYKYLYSFKPSNHKEKFDFYYPADDVDHKNHYNLIKAFILLAKDGYFPSLALTIQKNNQLINFINETNLKFSTRIINLGFLQRSKSLNILSNCKALVFPSYFESLGLPLIEATYLNVPIISSDLDYVYEVCDPIKKFDPFDIDNIYQCLKDFLLEKNIKLQEKKFNFDDFEKLL